MISLEKILVAVDFSDHAKRALDYGAELARTFGSQLIVGHVVAKPDFLSQIPPGGEGYFPPNAQEIAADEAKQECEQWLRQVAVKDAKAVVVSGTPFVEIIKLARAEDVDLIIVGTHGRGVIAHALLGSVAEKVVQKASCPVLTVREGEHDFVMP